MSKLISNEANLQHPFPVMDAEASINMADFKTGQKTRKKRAVVMETRLGGRSVSRRFVRSPTNMQN